MIVVDTNIISCMIFPTRYSAAVSALHKANSVWEAPMLWKSEFLNVLALSLRRGLVTHAEAVSALEFAGRLIGSREHAVVPGLIIETVVNCSCSSYDCEFVVLAKQLGTCVITYNRKLIQAFPELAMTPDDYLKQ